MGAANGNLGGIAVHEETTAWGVPEGTPTWVWQHPMPSSLGLRRSDVTPNLLSYAAHTAREYAGKWVDGDLVVGLELDDAIIGPILGLAGTYSVDHYTLGDGSAPDVNSLTVLMNYGGGGGTPADNFEYWHSGVKANSVRIDLNPDTNASLTMVGIGSTTLVNGTATTVNSPAETGVFMPADAGTATFLTGTKTMCLYSASFEALVPKTGFDDRRCIGGSIKEPITNGRPDCTFTLNLDLDDGATNETDSIVSAWVNGTLLGDIEIGTDFVLNGCRMVGDFPPLKEGQIDLVVSGTCESIEVYC